MAREIDVKEWKIIVLEDELATRFEVPRIQRTYAWEKKEIEDFVVDLVDVSSDNYSQHYFGAFCTAEKDDDDIELIIDGQQRIATTHLFLKCVQDRIQDTSLKRQVNNIILKPKIKLGKNDHEIFEKIMKGETETVSDTDKESKLYKAYQTLAKKLTEKTEIDKLVRTLLYRFKLVKIRLPYKNFKQTFHLVNYRGKSLTPSELIKSHIFMDLETGNKISSADLDKLDRQWTEMSEKIRLHSPRSARPIDEFIQHILSIKHGEVNLNSIYEIAKRDFSGSSRAWLLDLFKWGAWYMNLLKPPETFAEPSVSGRLNVKTWLERIKSLTAKNIYPILLVGYKKYFLNNNKKDFYRLVDSCYRFHVRVKTLGNMNVDLYTKTMQRIAKEMHTNDLKLKTVIHRLDCCIKKNVERAISDSIIDIKMAAARPCLLLIEEYENGVEKIANTPTVEHILPKNYANSDWAPYLDSTYPDDPELFVNHLGNMVLLSGPKNSELRDKLFSEKFKKYENSHYKITQELYGKKSWTPIDIEERGTRYVKSLEHALDITKYPRARNR